MIWTASKTAAALVLTLAIAPNAFGQDSDGSLTFTGTATSAISFDGAIDIFNGTFGGSVGGAGVIQYGGGTSLLSINGYSGSTNVSGGTIYLSSGTTSGDYYGGLTLTNSTAIDLIDGGGSTATLTLSSSTGDLTLDLETQINMSSTFTPTTPGLMAYGPGIDTSFLDAIINSSETDWNPTAIVDGSPVQNGLTLEPSLYLYSGTASIGMSPYASPITLVTPGTVATNAVPEPSTWTLALGGFALVIAAQTYRRTTVKYRAANPAKQVPDPVTRVEQGRAEEEHAEDNRGDDERQDGPRIDVKLTVGLRLGAHGRKVNSLCSFDKPRLRAD